ATKYRVRYVKFSPEEMAYEIPDDTSGFIPIGRGLAAYERFREWKKTMIRLEPDVAKFFHDAAAVNNALRKLIEAIPPQPVKGKKTASLPMQAPPDRGRTRGRWRYSFFL